MNAALFVKAEGRRRMAAALVLSGLLGGCYESGPQLPSGTPGSPGRSGWPPAAVYSPEPFHPANRLFQRLYVLRAEGPVAGAVTPSQTDVPFSSREGLGAVDRAEVRALLKAISGEDRIADPTIRRILASDLISLAARLSLREGGDRAFLGDLAQAAVTANQTLGNVGEPVEATPLPPPLRAGGWREEEGPPHAAFRPSAADLRWTRTFRREGESALLRLRIAVDPGGEPVLLPIGSEAWLLTAVKGSAPSAKVYQLKREQLVRRAEPWEEVAVATIRDPGDPSRPPLSGKVPQLCAGCHPGPGLEVRGGTARPSTAPPSGSGAGSLQREDARRALAGIPF